MPKQAFNFKIESFTLRFEVDTMNPYPDKEYFGARRYKLRVRKIAGKPKTSGVKMNNYSFCMNSVVSKP